MRRAAGILISLAVLVGVARERSNGWGRAVSATAILMVLTMACGSGSPSARPSGTATAPGAISIPTGNLSAYYQCMLDAGWEITGVQSPRPGESPNYMFQIKGDVDEAKLQQCDALQPSHAPMTEAEIRETYDRWVGEYNCLIGLGYQPDPPPSVETFVAGWNTPHQGPWMPIDGVDTDHWTQAQYDEAKAKCTLEFLLGIPASH